MENLWYVTADFFVCSIIDLTFLSKSNIVEDSPFGTIL